MDMYLKVRYNVKTRKERRKMPMKHCKIAICDQEVDYAFGLMNYINGQPENPCMAMAFTNEDNLLNYLQSNQVELLLAGDNLTLTLPNHIPVLWLTDGQDVVHEDSLYKYQSTEHIIPSILEHIPDKTILNLHGSQGSTKVYGVYSPIGRCGKTNLALAICHYQGHKSLYIGFEEYSSFPDSDNSSEELYYYIKQKDASILGRLHHLTNLNESCHIINSPSCYLDLRQIGYEELEWFIHQLKSTGYYETIVFDIGVGSLFDYDILELFDKIFMPYLDNSIANIKKDHFFQFLSKSNYTHIKDKINIVLVPDLEYTSPQIASVVKQCFESGGYA